MSSKRVCGRGQASAAVLLLGCFLATFLGVEVAGAATGYYALDDAAITIKNPGQTPLVAVTRAGQTLVAVGLHGVIVTSQDNGESWIQANVPVDVTLTSVYFENDRQGWAVGHYGVVLSTQDGGRNWTREQSGLDVIAALVAEANREQTVVPPPETAAKMQRVAQVFQAAGPSKPFLAVGSCGHGILAAGQQDMAVLSNDNGKSWNEWTSKIDNPHYSNIYGIFNHDGQTFLVGENGMVLSGDAGCENFKSLTPPLDETLFGGMAVNEDDLLVYGLTGGVFKSEDYGKTWTSLVIPTDANVTSGLVLPSGNVLLGTLGGELYLGDKQIDHFSRLPMKEPFQIAGMALAPNGAVVVVGDIGAKIIPPGAVQ
jgi:photosystem II stability/assembly factor-like uncharacterized protein